MPIFIKPQIVFNAVVLNTETHAVQNVDMIFQQPIQITFRERYLIIRACIVEKSVTAYMGMGTKAKAYSISKSNNDDFVSDILNFFLRTYAVAKCDINRGLKHLSDKDVLDLRSLNWIEVDSAKSVVMNEGLTYKAQYPDQYSATMMAPLTKSIFKYLPADDDLCRQFTADPSAGQISVSLYPKNATQTENVIAQILANN